MRQNQRLDELLEKLPSEIRRSVDRNRAELISETEVYIRLFRKQEITIPKDDCFEGVKIEFYRGQTDVVLQYDGIRYVFFK